MEMIGDMKVFSWTEVEDELYGRLGSQEREEYEREVNEKINAYRVGEAIKQARKEKNLTQAQLGELMGVQRSQISKIESGKNINFSTLIRAFKAMNIHSKLSFGKTSIVLS